MKKRIFFKQTKKKTNYLKLFDSSVRTNKQNRWKMNDNLRPKIKFFNDLKKNNFMGCS